MFNRKGVSEVVANVLIVLLVIVGIAVIWSVVKPTIDRTSDSVRADCFTAQVEPVSCTPGTTAGTWDVKIKRNPGAGSFEDIDVIFEDVAGTTQRVPTGIDSIALEELETQDATDLDDTPITATKANIVLTANGQLCQVTTQAVDCG